MTTFGEKLLNFSHAIDYIDHNTYHSIMRKIKYYITNNYEPLDNIIVALQTIRDGRETLKGVWPTDFYDTYKDPSGGYWNKPIEENGKYVGHSSFVYTKGKKAWIVAANQGKLVDTNDYKDLFGLHNEVDIPKFVPAMGVDEYKTSVIHPVKSDFRTVGIVNLEFKAYLEPNEPWEQEFERISNSILLLYNLYKHQMKSSEATSFVIEDLNNHDILPKGDSRALFFSPGSDASTTKQVRGCILETLKKYSRYFAIKDWREPTNSDIAPEIRRQTQEAVLAIVYLSEPDDSGENKFRDNQNTLYELGLLHGVRDIGSTPLKDVIIIREAESPPAPFNIGGISHIKPNRFADGALNKDDFTDELERAISKVDNSWKIIN